MLLHFNVVGEQRKAMVKAVEKELGINANYLAAPTFAYQVGNYTIGKDGELDIPDDASVDESSKVIDDCVCATGNTPTEWEEQNSRLTVSIPLENVDIGNLINLLESKGDLIKKALGINNTYIEEHDGVVDFSWFDNADTDDALVYTTFISSICEMTKKQKRISAKKVEAPNEKYAFRCFLLRLGFIGDEYKNARKVLLKNLEGSSAFKTCVNE